MNNMDTGTVHIYVEDIELEIDDSAYLATCDFEIDYEIETENEVIDSVKVRQSKVKVGLVELTDEEPFTEVILDTESETFKQLLDNCQNYIEEEIWADYAETNG